MMSSDDATLAAEGITPAVGERGVARMPERIGRFMILETLGAGGMGIVYAAYDPELDRKVALKLIRPDRADDSARVRLIREAQAMARLTHPNVVAVYDTGIHGRGIYLVMEYVEGTTLDGWLAAEARSWEEVRAAFLELGSGVAAAHAVGLIHRDLKPGNVLVAQGGAFKVADFGLARGSGSDEDRDGGDETGEGALAVIAPEPALADPSSDDATLLAPPEAGAAPYPSRPPPPIHTGPSSIQSGSSLHSRSSLDSELTVDGAVLGTPRYMAPEQVRGERSDASSDQFSFCVAFYEALYGELPFPGDNLAQRYQAILDGRLRPAPSTNPTPSWLRAVVVRGLAADKDARWPSMGTLLEALARDPRRRWRRIGVAAAFVAMLGVAAGVGARVSGGAAEQCSGAEAELEQVWDADVRAAVRARFEASEIGYAAHTADMVERELDAYAQAWIAAWTDACEATRVRAVQSEALLDARMRCLDARRRELDALSDNLARARTNPEDERRVLERAISAVGALPRIEPCADVEYLTAAIPPPDDPQVAAEVEGLRERLALARSQLHFAAYEDAEAALREGLSKAETLDYPPILAEHTLELGRVYIGQGRYDEAHEQLRASVLEAEAAGADALARDAAIDLFPVIGVDLAKSELAEPWSALAEAKLRRREAPLARANWLRSRGRLLGFRGDYEAAIAVLQEGRELRARELGERSLGVATMWNELGSIYKRTGDFERSLDAHERALAIYEEVLGSEHPDVATILNNIGASYSDHVGVEAALPYLQRSLEIRERSLPPKHPAIGASLVNLGNIHLGRGELDEARDHFERARDILAASQGETHPNVAACLINLGVVYDRQGDNEAARGANERAIAIFEQSAPDSPDMAIPMVNLGYNLLDAGEREQALAWFERARDQLERTAGPEHFRMIEALAGLASAQLELQRSAEAIATAERGLAIAESSESHQPIRRAGLEFVLARALVEGAGDRRRARTLAERARAAFAEAGGGSAEQREQVETWLREHGEG
jgi:serine/threonine protein kinase/Tfp pilus assembly protein PilF